MARWRKECILTICGYRDNCPNAHDKDLDIECLILLESISMKLTKNIILIMKVS